MASMHPVEFYGLTVPGGGLPVPANEPGEDPVTVRITMAAIDPTAKPIKQDSSNDISPFLGATLKIIRVRDDEDDLDSDEDEDDYDMAGLLDDAESDSDEESDEEPNGGPSDPEKSPKLARKKAAAAALKEALTRGAMDIEEDMNDNKVSSKAKGKSRAQVNGESDDSDEEDEDEEDGSEEEDEESAVEEFVLCTLDPTKMYQQPLDITIGQHETVYFSAEGTHHIYLTGNIVIPADLMEDENDSENEYDLPPDEHELLMPGDEDESDELDDMDDPRIMEVESEDDTEAPKLAKSQRNKKKRAAEDSDEDMPNTKESLDDLISKSLKATNGEAKMNGEPQVSKAQLKKQRKKLKDNEGNAVETIAAASEDKTGPEDTKAGSTKSDKKVQFAKTLVQGPSNSSSSSPALGKVEAKAKAENGQSKPNGTDQSGIKATLGTKTVQGVIIDDKKLGKGPAAKKGDKVSMRYIGKLEKDKRVFDSNKKGKPFTFQIGSGEVIKGWDIGVNGMSVGGERRITIPAHLAYGSKSSPRIPSNSTLQFDLKVLEIK